MDARIKDFIGKVVVDVVGLDVALFFQAEPSTFDTAAGLALRLHRPAEEIQPALNRLVGGGTLEVETRDGGHYQVYSLGGDPETWRLLCLVSEIYLDHADARKEIVRMLVHPHTPPPEADAR
jgi:hypothetical protein